MQKAAIALILLVLLGGCGFKDIDKRLFAVAIGFDKSQSAAGGYKVLLKIAMPQGDPKGGTQQFAVLEQESKSIAEALRRMKSKVDKELDYSHTKAIVIGEEVAKENISSIIDWAARRRDIQQVGLVSVGSPTAEAVLQVKPKGERIPANSLFLALGHEGTESPYIIRTYLFDLERRLTEEGLDPIMPVVEAKRDDLVIDKSMLFGKGKGVLKLSPPETRLLKLLTERNLKSDLAITQPVVFSMNVERSSASYRIVTGQQARPYVNYELKIEGILEEEHFDKRDIDPDTIHYYNKLLKEDVEQRMKLLLNKLKEHEVDPIGLGLRYVSRTMGDGPKYEKWLQMYPELEFRVTAKVELKVTGKVL
ncbi:germination protein, Ger(x)C family [Paenibacillus sp. UNCCL117]|uniref:Ger(x)C family spore germination protein n=1 Tax=unclassified Paenibacillus TaxID=185978 RepID=UPI00088F382A|nr:MULTISPECIES: Ger(x)C family spore germination protein [unclassified Paenibacillus]SDC92091.1 germination protein, Ger(x)C family [Paenibacillus sp. cl123]SFW29244.1 germination protein, Ger(x)C family [Paenibacillus sp. UNCCL117]